ncbi:MAG TPA: hypothetical protein VK465_08245, partial [Fibrobacteria bacterium]|nr:hypothetical protein [Fibrobacteria bacterium]
MASFAKGLPGLHGVRHGLLPSLFLAAALASAAPAEAQGKAPIPALDLRWDPGRPGDSLVLRVKVDLPQGWYINSHAPLDSFLVPTRLEASAPGLVFGPTRWPKPVVEHSD